MSFKKAPFAAETIIAHSLISCFSHLQRLVFCSFFMSSNHKDNSLEDPTSSLYPETVEENDLLQGCQTLVITTASHDVSRLFSLSLNGRGWRQHMTPATSLTPLIYMIYLSAPYFWLQISAPLFIKLSSVSHLLQKVHQRQTKIEIVICATISLPR